MNGFNVPEQDAINREALVALGTLERPPFLMHNLHVLHHRCPFPALILANSTLEWSQVFQVDNLQMGAQMQLVRALVVAHLANIGQHLVLVVFGGHMELHFDPEVRAIAANVAQIRLDTFVHNHDVLLQMVFIPMLLSASWTRNARAFPLGLFAWLLVLLGSLIFLRDLGNLCGLFRSLFGACLYFHRFFIVLALGHLSLDDEIELRFDGLLSGNSFPFACKVFFYNLDSNLKF